MLGVQRAWLSVQLVPVGPQRVEGGPRRGLVLRARRHAILVRGDLGRAGLDLRRELAQLPGPWSMPLSRCRFSLPPVTLPLGRTISPSRVTSVAPPPRLINRRAVGRSCTTTVWLSASSTAGRISGSKPTRSLASPMMPGHAGHISRPAGTERVEGEEGRTAGLVALEELDRGLGVLPARARPCPASGRPARLPSPARTPAAPGSARPGCRGCRRVAPAGALPIRFRFPRAGSPCSLFVVSARRGHHRTRAARPDPRPHPAGVRACPAGPGAGPPRPLGSGAAPAPSVPPPGPWPAPGRGLPVLLDGWPALAATRRLGAQCLELASKLGDLRGGRLPRLRLLAVHGRQLGPAVSNLCQPRAPLGQLRPEREQRFLCLGQHGGLRRRSRSRRCRSACASSTRRPGPRGRPAPG